MFWCRWIQAPPTCAPLLHVSLHTCDLKLLEINTSAHDLVFLHGTDEDCSWVVSTLLPESILKTNLSTNRIYDPKKSSTWKQLSDTKFNVTYDNGELGATGVVGTETVNIGSANATDFPIGAATNIFGPTIVDPTFDGTFGLGWPLQNSGAPTLAIILSFCLLITTDHADARRFFRYYS